MPPVFDYGSFMDKELGLTFKGTNPDGTVQVVDKNTGEEQTFDAPTFMQKELKLASNYPVEYNKPDAPVEISPLTTADRVKLSVGNAKGSLNYLKTKFEEAQYNPDEGFVVKKNGVWSKVDPSGLGGGNPWDMTKELVKDIADWGGDAAVVGPSIGGSIAAGPPGAVAGAAAGSTIKTVLGRAVGTYDATPEEQMFDIGFDTLLALGGEGVAAGAKVYLPGAGKAIARFAKNTSEPVKRLWGDVLGRTTGAGSEAANTLINNAPETMSVMSRLAKVATDGSDLQTKAAGQQFINAKSLIETASQNLTKEYSKGLQSIIDHPDAAGMTVDFKELTQGLRKYVEDQGLGRFGRKRGLHKLSGRSLASRAIADQPGQVIDDEAFRQLKSLFKKVEGFESAGTLAGPKAIKPLLNMNRLIKDHVFDLPANASENTKRLLNGLSSEFKNSTMAQFEKAGLGKQFAQMQERYSFFANDVKLGKKALSKGEAGLETLVKKLMADGGSNVAMENTANRLAALAGDQGKKSLHNIRVLEVAKRFYPILPKGGFPSFALGGLAVHDSGNVITRASGSTFFSPRAATLQVRAALQTADFIKKLPYSKVQELLANPELSRSLVETVGGAAQHSADIENQLVNGALKQ